MPPATNARSLLGIFQVHSRTAKIEIAFVLNGHNHKIMYFQQQSTYQIRSRTSWFDLSNLEICYNGKSKKKIQFVLKFSFLYFFSIFKVKITLKMTWDYIKKNLWIIILYIDVMSEYIIPYSWQPSPSLFCPFLSRLFARLTRNSVRPVLLRLYAWPSTPAEIHKHRSVHQSQHTRTFAGTLPFSL